MEFLDSLIKEGWLKKPRIIEAFRKIKRVDFLPLNLKDLAQLNQALPIGYGQTISQPLVVAFMIELLNPQVGEKILDIGAGSGWTSAILGYLVKGEKESERKGKVIALEIIPQLVEFGKKNVSKYNFIKKGIVEFYQTDGWQGFEKEAPFDKILCSASIQSFQKEKETPQTWKTQLKIGGKIVTPIDNAIWCFFKKSKTEFEKKEYPGFVFVPLVKKENHYGKATF